MPSVTVGHASNDPSLGCRETEEQVISCSLQAEKLEACCSLQRIENWTIYNIVSSHFLQHLIENQSASEALEHVKVVRVLAILCKFELSIL
jgi:hypothetical protein